MRTIRGRRVLVVEDDYFLALELASFLRGSGASVAGPASSVRAALGLLADELAPDVAVLDIELLDGLVFDVAAELTALSIPFIFSTGHGPDIVRGRFAKTPMLRKPSAAAAVQEELERELAATARR